MIDHSQASIQLAAVHHVGNKTNAEQILLSKSVLDISDNTLQSLLIHYFLSPFNTPEFYSFSFSNGDHNLNPLYNYAEQVFEDDKAFLKSSVDIAKHLYEVSNHPQIKAGDLFVCLFNGILLNDKKTEALGIFKSETIQQFLKLSSKGNDFSLNYDDGIDTNKLDKGCLVFNAEKDFGYKLCIVDKSGKGQEAQFWKSSFLMAKPLNDSYHFTKDLLSVAKDFIVKTMPSEFEVDKKEQIDYLNKSVGYFKENETFNIQEFEKNVFGKEEVIESFRRFGSLYVDRNDIDIADNFEISHTAVKKQERIFKSVLKLDKNFHVYIHGRTDLLEKGYDSQKGKHFYKIYFDTEA